MFAYIYFSYININMYIYIYIKNSLEDYIHTKLMFILGWTRLWGIFHLLYITEVDLKKISVNDLYNLKNIF